MEVIGVEPFETQVNGKELNIEVLAEGGLVQVHAVTAMEVGVPPEAACGGAARRLAPTFWLWREPHPDHLIRCPDCLKLYPLGT